MSNEIRLRPCLAVNYDKSHYVVFYIREQVGVGGAIKGALQKDDIPTNANDFGQGRGGVSFSSSGSGNSIQNLTNKPAPLLVNHVPVVSPVMVIVFCSQVFADDTV